MQTVRYLSFLFLIIFSLSLEAQNEPDDLKPDLTIMIPMRDGTLLPTDLYFPTPDARGLPCILLRSSAGRASPPWKSFAKMAKAGYVVAIQDARNVLDKKGRTMPFIADGWGKVQDGYDSIEWLAKSPYTNGKIGTWGSSALGITQLLTAPANPPSLKCQYIVFAAASLYHHAIFPGGQLLKNQTEQWLGYYAHDTGSLNQVCQRPLYNEFWEQFDTLKVANQVRVPAIFVAGWYDTFLQGTIAAFTSRQYLGGEGAKDHQKIIIGPWTHFWPLTTKLGDFDVPQAGMAPPYDISPKSWFDHYLKDISNDIENLPPVIYYVMGPFDGSSSSGNVWRTSEVWPIPTLQFPVYLTPDLGLQEDQTFEGFLAYEYHPHEVIPTIGGHNLFLEAGPKDQSSIEDRDDILVFTSVPLKEDVEITGEIAAKIYFSTNQPDTDIILRLCDVYPDGKSILITEGIYRLGVMCHIEKPELHLFKKEDEYAPVKLIADQPREVNMSLLPTSIVFAKGHSIRLSISSSNYPRYEKNLNIGLRDTNTGKFQLAKNKVYMGSRYPSQIILPVFRKGDTWFKSNIVQYK